MISPLRKNTFREIYSTKARFFSILAIIALGVGFFTGIKAASPAMTKTAANYYVKQNLMDFNIVSTVGFEADDIKAIQNIDGVTAVQPSYFSDVIVNSEGVGNVVRMYAMPSAENNETPINNLNLTEGRLPQKSGEVVVEKKYLNKGYSIGDKLKIEPTVGDTDTFSILNTLEYTVVGVVESPLYISFERGVTTVGSGSISTFVYIMPQDFAVERYTQVYVTTKYLSSSISPFSDEYKNGIDDIKQKLEELSEERLNAFDTKYLSGARQELSNGVAEYEQGKRTAEKELEQAQTKLTEGQKLYDQKVKAAESSLSSASDQIASGEEAMPNAIRDYYDTLSDAQEQINDAEIKLSEGKQELKQAQKEYDDKISEAEQKLADGKTQYQAAYTEFYTYTKPQAEKKLDALGKLLDKAQTAINTIEEQLKNADGEIATKLKEDLAIARELLESYQMQIDYGKQQLADGEQKLIDTKAQLESGEAQLNQQKETGKTALEQAAQKIATGQAQLEQAKSKYYSGKASGKQQLDSAMAQLEEGKAQISLGQQQLEEQKQKGLEELEQGNEQLKTAKLEAEEKLEAAKAKLDEAQQKLDEYSAMKWYVNTRDDNPGYSGLLEDTGRVDAVATVFPLFFLLVAALVCFTTMTRMVEEHRTEIGTFKALGYSSAKIASKYLIYATVAGITGCIIGIAICLPILPRVIFDAYKLMYILPDLEYVIPWDIICYGVIVAILCTSIVAVATCYKTLKQRPSKLMRPKTPKAGKRILLEKIGFIWNKLGFTSKVTARNLFRYKARLFMTVLGVAGCTALIVAGFGLKDSIGVIVDKQYTNISLYNTVIIPKTAGTQEKLQDTYTQLATDERLDALVLTRQSGVDVDIPNKDGKIIDDVEIITPSSIKDFKTVLDMHDRQTGESVKLTNDGVVLTEKLASQLGVKAGDKISYVDADQTYKVKVTGVCENYIYNYIYMSPNMYNQMYNTQVEYNMLLGTLNDTDNQDSYAQEVIARDDITAVTFIQTGIQNFQNMIKGLNTIVFVMIFCAGALAFVVLYNLTNINIAERQREIATIKVLGFYNKEVGSYVYRESIILTILGIVAGLILGIVLNNFIIQTVEIDKVMFGRDIFPQSFFYAAGLTALFATIVNGFMYFKMKAISMVESLKSIE